MGISSSINACPVVFVPGLLSSTYSEGYNTIVNDSKASLNCPVRYENRADSTSALWIDLNGLLGLLPLLSKESDASKSSGLT